MHLDVALQNLMSITRRFIIVQKTALLGIQRNWLSIVHVMLVGVVHLPLLEAPCLFLLPHPSVLLNRLEFLIQELLFM